MVKKKTTPIQKDYQIMQNKMEPKRKTLINVIRSFLVGGLICTFAQLLQTIFIKYFGFEESKAGTPAIAVLIILAALLTGLGIFDHFAQWAGAGTAVPITDLPIVLLLLPSNIVVKVMSWELAEICSK